jgi:hypothetical protein
LHSEAIGRAADFNCRVDAEKTLQFLKSLSAGNSNKVGVEHEVFFAPPSPDALFSVYGWRIQR